jgi:ribosomal protein S18 acetylase RimI-like enzyme
VLSLVPMPRRDLAEWLARSLASYIEERVGAGEDWDTASRLATSQSERHFPKGRPAPGQHVYLVVDDETPVGTLWIGESGGGAPGEWWVWTVEVDETLRGRGFGRATMLLAEQEARLHGATRLGLNVFGPNRVARRLYESLGYEVTALQMNKSLL